MVSIKFPPIILGPEMAAPILWAPGIFAFFLLENPHAHKIPPFRGGVLGFSRRGGVEVPILFLWAWGFFRFKGLPTEVRRRSFPDLPGEVPQTSAPLSGKPDTRKDLAVLKNTTGSKSLLR